jgi:hypothetical protein
MSGTPREITFRCAVCGETFETTRDPAVLKQYRRYPYVMRDRAGRRGPRHTPSSRGRRGSPRRP